MADFRVKIQDSEVAHAPSARTRSVMPDLLPLRPRPMDRASSRSSGPQDKTTSDEVASVKIYVAVKNIPTGVSTYELMEMFPGATVNHTTSDTERRRVVVIVFNSHVDAKKACKQHNNSKLGENHITVKIVKDPNPGGSPDTYLPPPEEQTWHASARSEPPLQRPTSNLVECSPQTKSKLNHRSELLVLIQNPSSCSFVHRVMKAADKADREKLVRMLTPDDVKTLMNNLPNSDHDFQPGEIS